MLLLLDRFVTLPKSHLLWMYYVNLLAQLNHSYPWPSSIVWSRLSCCPWPTWPKTIMGHLGLRCFEASYINSSSKMESQVLNNCWQYFLVTLLNFPTLTESTEGMFILYFFAEALCDHVPLQRVCQNNHSGLLLCVLVVMFYSIYEDGMPLLVSFPPPASPSLPSPSPTHLK